MISLTTQMPDGLADLINADRVHYSIHRLFQNDIAECLSELFQNSQRGRVPDRGNRDITCFGDVER